MISTLTIILIFFITAIVLCLFRIACVRGETYDVTTLKLKKNGKLSKYLLELQEAKKFLETLTYENKTITSYDGLKLSAKYFKNKNSDKIIIMFHGYRSIAENDFAAQAKWYYELGYNVLMVDQRSHGKSEGKYITFGIKERYDVVSWCEYVERNFENINEIILAGMSMGSTTVLLASALNLPRNVKGVIADCGFTSPKDIMSKVAERRYGINGKIILPFVNILCRNIAKFDLYEANVPDAMQQNKLPILFIHGQADDFVPSQMSKENFNACRSKKGLVLVDTVNHGLSYFVNKKKVQNEIQKFLKEI